SSHHRHLRRRRPEAVQRTRRPPLQRRDDGGRARRGLLAGQGGQGDPHDAVGLLASVLLRGLPAAMSRSLALAGALARPLALPASRHPTRPHSTSSSRPSRGQSNKGLFREDERGVRPLSGAEKTGGWRLPPARNRRSPMKRLKRILKWTAIVVGAAFAV